MARSSGYPIKAMSSMIISVLSNLILAPLFIFVFHWGIRGAAFATVLSQMIGLSFLIIHFLSKESVVHYTSTCFKLSKDIIYKIFSIGLSPFVVHIGAFLVIVVVNLQLKKYGGDFAIGAAGIINSISGLIIMIIFGFAQGMQPIIGFNFGAKQYQRMWDTFKLSIIWATVVASLAWGVALVFPQIISRAFTTDPDLIAQTANGIRRYFLVFPIIGYQLITSHFFLSIGKAKVSIFLSLFRQVIVLIPFLLILPTFWGVNGVWFSEPIASSFAMIMSLYIMYRWYAKQTWRTVIEN